MIPVNLSLGLHRKDLSVTKPGFEMEMGYLSLIIVIELHRKADKFLKMLIATDSEVS